MSGGPPASITPLPDAAGALWRAPGAWDGGRRCRCRYWCAYRCIRLSAVLVGFREAGLGLRTGWCRHLGVRRLAQRPCAPCPAHLRCRTPDAARPQPRRARSRRATEFDRPATRSVTIRPDAGAGTALQAPAHSCRAATALRAPPNPAPSCRARHRSPAPARHAVPPGLFAPPSAPCPRRAVTAPPSPVRPSAPTPSPAPSAWAAPAVDGRGVRAGRRRPGRGPAG